MNKISILLTYLFFGIIWLIIAGLIYYSLPENELIIIKSVLFIFLFIASLIASNINFRDQSDQSQSEDFIFWKKVKIAKMYVAIGLWIPLIVLSGVIAIKHDSSFLRVVLFVLFFFVSLIVSNINFRNQRIEIPKLYVATGLFWIPLLVLYSVTAIKYDPSFIKDILGIFEYNQDNIGIFQAVLFGLLSIASLIASIINFRDPSGKLVSFKKVKIPKLYAAIGLFWIPLLILYGVTAIEMEKVNRDARTTIINTVRDSKNALRGRIDTSTSRLSTRLDTVRDSLKGRIDTSRDSIATRLDTVDNSLGHLSTRLDTVRDSVDSLSIQIDTVDKSLQFKIDTSTNRLSTRLDIVRDSVDSIATRLDTVRNFLNSINLKFQADSNKIDSIEKDLDSINSKIDSLLRKP